MNHRLLILATATAIAVPAVAAPASSPLELSTRMLVEKPVTAADGTVQTRLVAPTHAVPGDRVVVVLAYRNTGARALSGLTLADPVPAGIVFRGVAAGVPAPEVSVDGTIFSPLAASRPAEVRHVRWRLATPLAPGARGELSYRATIR